MLTESKFLALHKGIHAARPDGEISLTAKDARDMLASLASTGDKVLVSMPTPYAREWINKVAKAREQAAIAREALTAPQQESSVSDPDPNNVVG